RNTLHIHAERFAGEQMNRNGIGGKGIEHDEVVTLRSSGQGQAGVTEHDRLSPRAGRQETEVLRVARDANDFGIDLEEGPMLALKPVTRQAAGAEPDDRDLVEAALRATRGRDGLRYRTAHILIGQGLRVPRDGTH